MLTFRFLTSATLHLPAGRQVRNDEAYRISLIASFVIPAGWKLWRHENIGICIFEIWLKEDILILYLMLEGPPCTLA
ncbi:MAG: hypothetical protein RIC80_13970 [Cyclobacteriaceae bacterium]